MPEEFAMGLYKRLAEDRLKELLVTPEGGSGPLYDAMRYAASSGGKRVRASLVFAFFRACDETGDINIPADYASAVEMLHAASLIHDDLPSMDDDDFRRGQPSCHKACGEAMAILAGDGLFIKAFETIAACRRTNSGQNLESTRILAAKAGPDGMTGGQAFDISGLDRFTADKKAWLVHLHSRKTAALISASCMLGCIAAGAPKEAVDAAEKYGACLGLAYQVRDDMLDVKGSKDKLGKTPGKDKKDGKTTFVSLYGMAKSQKLCEKFTKDALDALLIPGRYFEGKTTPFEKLAGKLLSREY